jgi:hypothetical protein
MPLTDTAVRNAKTKDTAYSLTDERGLSVQVQPSGGKWWRLRYRFDGKAKMLSLGTYPDVTEYWRCAKDARRVTPAAPVPPVALQDHCPAQPIEITVVYQAVLQPVLTTVSTAQ